MAWIKSITVFAVTLAAIIVSFFLATRFHEDGENRVSFTLVDQHGQSTSSKDLGGKHLLVFFGFTNCRHVCPTQMSKLSNVMAALDRTGHSTVVTPVFISVDPERDDPPAVAKYLDHFHEGFVGLTGTRTALQATADSFKTLLDRAPENPTPGYQLNHTSIVYVVDPFSRVVDYIPFEVGIDEMTKRVRKLL